jgi:hypothetical protein
LQKLWQYSLQQGWIQTGKLVFIFGFWFLTSSSFIIYSQHYLKVYINKTKARPNFCKNLVIEPFEFLEFILVFSVWIHMLLKEPVSNVWDSCEFISTLSCFLNTCNSAPLIVLMLRNKFFLNILVVFGKPILSWMHFLFLLFTPFVLNIIHYTKFCWHSRCRWDGKLVLLKLLKLVIITLQMLLGILKIGMYWFVGLEYHFTPKPLAGYVVLFLLGRKLDIIITWEVVSNLLSLLSSFQTTILVFFPHKWLAEQ